MLPIARQDHLLREIELRGSVRSAEAAAHLGVSEVTIRRDIIELDRAGKLARVHGGAIALRATRGPQAASALVGVIVPNTTTHFPDTVRGMESLAPSLRVRLVLGVSQYRPEVEEAQVSRMLGLGVQGIAIVPTTRDREPDDVARWLRSIPVPVVLVERRPDPVTSASELDQARTDHAHGAILAAEHLAGLGHDRIALAVFDRSPTAPYLREGFARAAARLGLAGAPDVVLPKGDEDPAALDATLNDLLDACRATNTRAVFAHTDYHAARLVELALDRGLRVPDDLAVVAYDDENAALAVVPLTTVTPPRRELGRQALKLLVERMTEDEPGPRTPRHVELLPGLTIRSSCGAGRTA
ncbi:substrate-binding domain-containing protein [Myceligenerans crystallogenes]|uniref:Substrate-binding domain-containing protein n=1 Tax=Myceligenerans crystallogenes TaxID=316335 RepID=A0ABN2N1R3_9MICO